MCELDASTAQHDFGGLRVALIGKFGGMSQRELRKLIRELGGIPVERVAADVDLVVIGADELPLEEDRLLDEEVRKAALAGNLEILGESQLWQRLGLVSTMNELIAVETISPFIAVMPLEAIFTPPQTSQFGNAIVQDLIPWIDMNYRTLPEKQYRAIGGVSRGAAWAVHLGFEDYEYFSRVGAHSLPLFEADGGKLAAWMYLRPIDELPIFFIDIGRNDQEWKTAEDFANLLDENNIPHEWYLFNGGHTEEYWSSHLEQYLRWYAADW